MDLKGKARSLTPSPGFFRVCFLMSKFLEIGPGRGDFLFFLAEQDPAATVVGVEYKRKRFDKLAVRREKRGLLNVDLRLGDARQVLPRDCSDEEFDHIFILFSDPWPKKRHAKHRLFQAPFVAELLRVLKPEGRVYIAHDDAKYVAQIQEVFRDFATSFVPHEDGVEFLTFYAEKWKKEGRLIRSFSYEKINIKEERNILGGPCAHIPFEEPGNVPEPADGSGL